MSAFDFKKEFPAAFPVLSEEQIARRRLDGGAIRLASI